MKKKINHRRTGEILHARRLELGMSAAKAAAELGVNVCTYYSWEAGQRSISHYLRQRVVKVFGIPYERLFWEELPASDVLVGLLAEMTLGQRIQFLREQRLMTRLELAELLACSETTIFDYEHGDFPAEPRLVSSALRAIAQALKVEPKVLSDEFEVEESEPVALTADQLLSQLRVRHREQIGRKLFSERKRQRMTQEALAAQFGIYPGTLADWEKGQTMPLQRELREMVAEFVKVPYRELFWEKVPAPEIVGPLMVDMILGQRLRFLRECRMMTVLEMAEECRCSWSIVAMYERDDAKGRYRTSKLPLIVRTLGVSMTELLAGMPSDLWPKGQISIGGNEMHEFGTELKNWRAEYKLSQVEAAKRLGIHHGTLSRYERGERVPFDRDVRQGFVEVTGRDYDTLFGLEDQKWLSGKARSELTFGEKLRLYRYENGMRQRELASILQAPMSSISQWETDFVLPNEEHRQWIADVLKMEYDELFGSSDGLRGGATFSQPE